MARNKPLTNSERVITVLASAPLLSEASVAMLNTYSVIIFHRIVMSYHARKGRGGVS